MNNPYTMSLADLYVAQKYLKKKLENSKESPLSVEERKELKSIQHKIESIRHSIYSTKDNTNK